MQREGVTDQLKRPIRDLRISVIDRCNFRCPYCMPEEIYGDQFEFIKKDQWLTPDQILKLGRAFNSLGVRKFRITGGEPLLRKDVFEIIQKLKSIDGIEDIALTTNGMYLSRSLDKLKLSGLDRITVSLDSINEDTFKYMSGGKGDLTKVLEGVYDAIDHGFAPIKLNVVIKKNINDMEVLNFIDCFKGTPVIIRFIEYMDVGNLNQWNHSEVVTSKIILDTINKEWQAKPLESNYVGEVASRYLIEDINMEIGFISSISNPFCGDCHRARITADGMFYTCLFANRGHNLAGLIKSDVDEKELINHISSLWKARNDRYSETRDIKIKFPTEKVEMFHMGG